MSFKKIEKENRKLRLKGKKEFNEQVRSLVDFVRKRDKRWTARKVGFHLFILNY